MSMEPVAAHYSSGGDLGDAIAERLENAGKDTSALTPPDLASVDEFIPSPGRAIRRSAAGTRNVLILNTRQTGHRR